MVRAGKGPLPGEQVHNFFFVGPNSLSSTSSAPPLFPPTHRRVAFFPRLNSRDVVAASEAERERERERERESERERERAVEKGKEGGGERERERSGGMSGPYPHKQSCRAGESMPAVRQKFKVFEYRI